MYQPEDDEAVTALIHGLRARADDLTQETARLSQMLVDLWVAINQLDQRVEYRHPGVVTHLREVTETIGSISLNDIGRTISSIEELIYCIRGPRA